MSKLPQDEEILEIIIATILEISSYEKVNVKNAEFFPNFVNSKVLVDFVTLEVKSEYKNPKNKNLLKNQKFLKEKVK